MRVEKRVLDHARLRRVPAEGFSWVDRRFVRDGFAGPLAAPEILLYFFLCAVADKDGLSYYGDSRLATVLKLDVRTVLRARSALERADLLVYREPLYQVLALPHRPPGALPAPPRFGDDRPRPLSDLIEGVR